jgi:hypothetical protein
MENDEQDAKEEFTLHTGLSEMNPATKFGPSSFDDEDNFEEDRRPMECHQRHNQHFTREEIKEGGKNGSHEHRHHDKPPKRPSDCSHEHRHHDPAHQRPSGDGKNRHHSSGHERHHHEKVGVVDTSSNRRIDHTRDRKSKEKRKPATR